MSEPVWKEQDLGVVSAFGVAKEHGWTGTESEWEALQAAAPELALKAESYGAGTRDGEPVDSDDPAYENNAEYYATQAQIAAASAAESAEDAAQYTSAAVHSWLSENIDPASDYALDRTLTEPLAAAPADLVGDLKSVLNSIVYDKLINVPLEMDAGFISASNGQWTDSGGYKCSQLIEVSEGITYEVKANDSSSVLMLAMYGNDTTTADLSNSIKGSNAEAVISGKIPSGIKKIRVSCANGYDVYVKIQNKATSRLEGEIVSAKAEIITENDAMIYKTGDTLIPGILNGDGSITEQQESSNFRVTNFLPVVPGTKYKITLKNILGSDADPRKICLYKKDRTWARTIDAGTALASKQFITYGTEYYVVVNISMPIAGQFDIYPEAYEDHINKLIPSIIVPQAKQKEVDTLHIRRPIIAIIFDGLYDLNQERADMVKDHGYRCSIAPQYVTAESGENMYSINGWANDGHEIIVHGNTILNDSVSESDGAAIIRASYLTMLSHGFDVKGFIASSGVLANKFYPYVKKYFSWGACVSNKYGSDTPYHVFSDDTYQLWRYSMQVSTLQEQKDAVDAAIANKGLLLLYAHCNSQDLHYFTAENFEALLDYIDTKVENYDISVKTATEAIAEYYLVRREDVVN
jgi:hypothetical protein